MSSSKNNNNSNNRPAAPDTNPASEEELADIDDPAELFRKAVGAVSPISDDKIVPKRGYVKPIPRQLEKDERAVMFDAMHDDRDPDELDLGEHLSWRRDGVQNRVMKKLRNGYYSIQDEVDLHGLTVAQAREELTEFVARVIDNKQSCCVRIIHGKGRKTATDSPVLKPFVSSWLRQRRHVMAFCSCKPAHGGTGAVYVLFSQGKNYTDE